MTFNQSINAQNTQRPFIIVGYGASTMRGWRPGVEPHETFRAVLEKGLQAQGIPAVVTDAAQPGNTSIDAMTRFERDVLNANPDVVLIDIGIGDSWRDEGTSEPRVPLIAYRANLRYWIKVLKACDTRIVMMTLQPMVSPHFGEERNIQIEKYVEVQRELAHCKELPLIDVYEHLSSLARQGVNLNRFYLDGQHFNVEGNRLVGEMLLDLERTTGFFSREYAATLSGKPTN